MQKNKDDFFIKSQIQSNIRTISELLNSDVFVKQDSLRVFQEPCFVSTILKLNDLLQKLKLLDNRITFTEDVIKSDEVVDITDLVRKIRNAICHLDSPENLLDKESQLKFVFAMIIGKGNAVSIGDNVVASSDYNDDIAFYYGEYRIYLNRHIRRALEEATECVKQLYPDDPFLLV